MKCTSKVRFLTLTLGVFYLAKYSESFKYKVVKEYLQGPLGYPLLARKYGIKSKTQLQNLVAKYKKFGAEGLYTKKNEGAETRNVLWRTFMYLGRIKE